MGMVQARFQIQLVPTASFEAFGKDQLELRFAANDGSPFQALKKVASGGELSRIMLAIKALLAQYQKLPTIIFDEIDTGVSGAISNEIALIMKAMAAHMQVFTITHLPQVAAKGQQHFKVYKTTYDTQTRTQIRELNAAERVEEIAQMLSGNELTQTAREHALQLLN
jgi:DNA repair protein RecN (Recombination protein N)